MEEEISICLTYVASFCEVIRKYNYTIYTHKADEWKEIAALWVISAAYKELILKTGSPILIGAEDMTEDRQLFR